jgi:hypothetical protein
MSQRAEDRGDDEQGEVWVSCSVDRSESERRELYSVEQKEPRVSISRILPFVEYEDGELHITRKFQR